MGVLIGHPRQAQIDEAYQTGCGSYGPIYVRSMVGPAADATTLRRRLPTDPSTVLER